MLFTLIFLLLFIILLMTLILNILRNDIRIKLILLKWNFFNFEIFISKVNFFFIILIERIFYIFKINFHAAFFVFNWSWKNLGLFKTARVYHTCLFFRLFAWTFYINFFNFKFTICLNLLISSFFHFIKT